MNQKWKVTPYDKRFKSSQPVFVSAKTEDMAIIAGLEWLKIMGQIKSTVGAFARPMVPGDI